MWKRCTYLVLLTALAALVQGTAAYGAFDPDSDASLLGHWKFDEGIGKMAADWSGNGVNGTLVGGASWAEGLWGSAVQFNGIDGYVDTTSTENVAKWTLSVWVMAPTAPGSSSPTGPVHREQNYQINWNHTDAVFRGATALSVGGTWYAASFGPMNAETWYHLVATYDGETLCAYKDGTLITANETPSGNPAAETNTLKFGRHAAAAQYMNGTVDEIHIYKRALTADEVTTFPAKPPKPKARKPVPTDGTIGVNVGLLQWTAGEGALFHNVYFGTSAELDETNLVATKQPMPLYYHMPGLQPGTTYYWRIDEVDAAGTVATGDVWSFVAQDVVAYHPDPVDKWNEATTSPTLTWQPGLAAVKHHLYFGDNLDAVTQRSADTDKGTVEVIDSSFTPEALEDLTTYYWCVDETVGGEVKAGPVWSFSTALSIDDFESYTDDTGNCIFDAWVDGFADGNSGSVVGHLNPPFAEQSIVHGGLQSMPFEYNNVATPFYSEAVLEPASATDWTSNGADTLVLYVHGMPGNKPAALYVTVEDTSKHGATVVHPDPAITTGYDWTPWKIPFSSFTGVNLARVSKLYLGVGDKANAVAGNAGTIYIDDICVTKP